MKADSSIALVISWYAQPMLLAVREPRGLCLPGGKVEPDETPQAACCRELREETGIKTLPGHIVYIAEGLSGTEDDRLVRIYHVREAILRGACGQWTTFEKLLAESPFADFYRRHLPSGIVHLPLTRFHVG
jgi:8-oxo-dGTP pyrophosphatase MutT (NUDIX family)